MARVLGGIDVAVSEGDGALAPRSGASTRPGPIAGDVRVLPFESSGRSRCASACARRRATGGSTRWRSHSSASRSSPRARAARGRRAGRGAGRARARAAAARRGAPGHAAGRRLPHRASICRRRGTELELFLESEGYYYEWMREGVAAEEDAGDGGARAVRSRAGAAADGGAVQGARGRHRAARSGRAGSAGEVLDARRSRPARAAARRSRRSSRSARARLRHHEHATVNVPVVGRTVTVVTEPARRSRSRASCSWWRRTGSTSAPRTACARSRSARVREARVKRHGFGKSKAYAWSLVGGLGRRAARSRPRARPSRTATAARASASSLWACGCGIGALCAPSLEASSRIELPRPTPEQLRAVRAPAPGAAGGRDAGRWARWGRQAKVGVSAPADRACWALEAGVEGEDVRPSPLHDRRVNGVAGRELRVGEEHVAGALDVGELDRVDLVHHGEQRLERRRNGVSGPGRDRCRLWSWLGVVDATGHRVGRAQLARWISAARSALVRNGCYFRWLLGPERVNER